uniref:Uncharacterized protein n=1 Tax=Plectus sambesii TaxID=2011161 RepID=A0A914VA46_9BILA
MVRSLRELSAEIVAELVKLAAENCWKEHREYRESNEQRLLNKKSAVAAISNNFSSHYVSDTGPLRIARELIDACNTRIPQDVRNFLKCHFFTLKFSGGYSLVQCRYGGVTKRSQVGNKSVMEGTLDTLK